MIVRGSDLEILHSYNLNSQRIAECAEQVRYFGGVNMIWRNSIETKFDGINFYGMKIEVDGQTKYYQGVFHTNDSYHSGNFIAVRRLDVGHDNTVCFNLRTIGGEFSEYCVKDLGQV